MPLRNSAPRLAALALFGSLLAPPLHAQGAGIAFQARRLYLDANEGAALADVDRDGRLDVIAGRNWFAAPDFSPRPLRLVEDWNGYVQSNGDHALDVNGDGWVDVVAGSFNPTQVHWYENPGPAGLEKGWLWNKHLLVDTGAGSNEISFMRDLDGDGVPEWVVNSWQKNAPVLVWKLARDAAGQPSMRKIVLSQTGNGHGMGFGDVNGDGREDMVLSGGWLERPAGDAFARPWTLHADWEPLEASCPMLVRDLNGDGRADLVVGMAHGVGLSWWEQLPPGADGATRWRRHEIDRAFSQAHALHWADLDGDGSDELITGKRKWAHNDGDPGAGDPPVLIYYRWDAKAQEFQRHSVQEGQAGTGLQIRTADLTGDGKTDIVVAGKSGTYLLVNRGQGRAGTAPAPGTGR